MFWRSFGQQQSSNSHPVDLVYPPGASTALAIQHMLAAYATIVVTPLVLASALGWSSDQLVFMLSACLITSGISTLIQCIGIGNNFIGIKLPVVQGTSLVTIPAAIMIGADSLNAMFGAVIIAGLCTLLLASRWSQLLRYFPPVVTGSVIAIIGLSLFPVSIMWIGGGASGPQEVDPLNIVLALFSMCLVVGVMIWGKGFISRIAILIGLFCGTLLAYFMGKVDMSNVASADWVGLVAPFALGLPEFELAAIFSMVLVMLVAMVESTGDYIAIGEVCDKPVGPGEIAAGLRAEGLGTILGGIMCSFPYTTFSQNTGVLRVSGVRSRWVVALCGVFLILAGIFPKLSALAACIPTPVLGGISLVLFGSIACTGLKILGTVDMEEKRNLVIVSVSVGLSMIAVSNPLFFSFMPASLQMLFNNAITLGAISALLLNYMLNIIGENFCISEDAEKSSAT